MPILTTDFAALTDDLEVIVNEVTESKVDDIIGTKVFGIKDLVRRTVDHLILHSIGGVAEVAQNEEYPSLDVDQGDTLTLTMRQFGGRIVISKQMRMFDLHDQIETITRSVVGDGFDKIDQSFADVLTYGTATSYTDVYGGTVTSTTAGGESLFNSAHTNGFNATTFSNLIRNSAGTTNVALARDPVVRTRAVAMRYSDPRSIVRPVYLDTLIVSPENEDLAERIVYSEGIVGSANREANALKGKIKNIIVWPRLSIRSDGTDTSARWFLADSSKVQNTLKAYFAQRPKLFPPETVNNTQSWEYVFDYLYVWGLAWPSYLYGSTGAA